MTRRFVPLIVVFAAACGTDNEANRVGDVGWVFDYRDWTSMGSTMDLRGCSNEPAGAGGGAFDDIDSVQVTAVDPQGQIQGFDTTFDCSEGSGDTVPIQGVARAIFDVTFVARSAAGIEL
ncbi:MAG: hypothetical protein AAF658_07170, partial [Myxococcota bacterium]